VLKACADASETFVNASERFVASSETFADVTETFADVTETFADATGTFVASPEALVRGRNPQKEARERSPEGSQPAEGSSRAVAGRVATR
jgi:hypothetical protein